MFLLVSVLLTQLDRIPGKGRRQSGLERSNVGLPGGLKYGALGGQARQLSVHVLQHLQLFPGFLGEASEVVFSVVDFDNWHFGFLEFLTQPSSMIALTGSLHLLVS